MKTIAGLVGLICVWTALAAGSASHAAPASRAVSLRAVSSALRSGTSSQQARSLCGITRLCGYLVDGDAGDVVLLGVVDPNRPALRIDDFVVALRNVRGAYNRIVGRTQYYSDPGCSIDPDPAVLTQLKRLAPGNSGQLTPESMQAHRETWTAIGRQPQKVRVMGVPFYSHFAKVMVDADYYMKRLVNGSVDLGIDGLRSLSDISMDESRQDLQNGKSSTNGGSMNRFWFSPGDSTYEIKEGAVLLRSCEVKLLTEEEFLNEHGAISQMGRPNAAADRFARSFTARYDRIAELRPIYKELKGLFVFVAIARLMKQDGADRTAAGALDYLAKSYRVGSSPVSPYVNGLTDFREITDTIDTPQGQSHITLIQSTCGGVSMSVRPKRIRSTKTASAAVVTKQSGKAAKPKKAAATGIKQAVLKARRSSTAMSWDVPVQLD